MLELKNVKIAAFASHETACFEASIYLDGKRIGKVWNDGNGGPNAYEWKGGKRYPFPDCVSKFLQTYDYVNEYMTPEQCADVDEGTKLESAICEALDRFEETKYFKRVCKTKIVAVTTDCKPGQFVTWKLRWTKINRDKIMQHMGDKIVEFINQRIVGDPQP